MYFDPRQSLYKEPFGAVPCDREVRFFVSCPEQDAFCACTLHLRDDFSGEVSETALCACAGGFSGLWRAPETATLLWYTFSLTRENGERVTLGQEGENGAAPWQQTVYDDSLPTPAWFGEGVTYQIFPDRFFRLAVPRPCQPGERRIHESWADAPDFLPDEKGEVRNCDFFGGSLSGITAKLDYLRELGVTTLYLNPIFSADSNHRYNTADYLTIDPMLGTQEDFRTLCQEAHSRGMRVLLDGVFNHTGSNSRYFNALGTFPEVGAAQSPQSPYASWYSFHPWPTDYDAWWGIRTLPAVNENDPSYRDFIIRSHDSVVRRWLRAGADGWRLDVADELPDDFIAELRTAMDEEKSGAFLLGEVWEDGSNKIAYSKRRRYLLGRETHGLMNYPFRTALLSYLRGGDAACFREAMEALREHYPPCAYYAAMNLLGTHDTPRILTALGIDHVPADKPGRAAFRLSPQQRETALARLRLAAAIQFCFPGSPTVYYGDEAGMEGLEDPFCRGTYPWGGQDAALLGHYRLLGALRRDHSALRRGDIRYIAAEGALLGISRTDAGETLTLLCNAGGTPLPCSLPGQGLCRDLFSGQQFAAADGVFHLTVPPLSALLLL